MIASPSVGGIMPTSMLIAVDLPAPLWPMMMMMIMMMMVMTERGIDGSGSDNDDDDDDDDTKEDRYLAFIEVTR